MKRARRETGDGGFVAGGEMVLVGAVAMMAVVLLMIELWVALDARIAVDDAAREATRAYVEASDRSSALTAARTAAAAVLGDRGRIGAIDPTIDDQGWGRCVRVAITVHAEVPLIALPGIGAAGTRTVTGRHGELIDPYRSSPGLEGVANCGP